MDADQILSDIDQLEQNGNDQSLAEAKRLRGEVKKYREAKEAAEAQVERYQAFATTPDEDLQSLAQFAQVVRANPAAAAQQAVAWGQSLAGVADLDFNTLVGGEPTPEPEVPDMANLTADQISEMVAKQVSDALAAQSEQQAIHDQIMSEVRALGYEGTVDDRRTHVLLSLAQKFDGDLNKAHEALTEMAVAAPDGAADPVESPEGDEAPQPDVTDVMSPPPDGVPAQGESQPTTLAEADAALAARLAMSDD